MDVLRPVRIFDGYQQRHRWLAVPMAVLRKFGDDHGGSQAALVAYYAFLSLFPLLLVLTTILGFILQGDPKAQQSIETSVLGQFPVIGEQIHVNALTGHAAALAVGLGLSLFGGLGVTQAAQNAFDTVWAVPFKDRPDFLRSRLRGLLLLLCLGLLFVASTVVSGFVPALGSAGVKVAGVVISLVVNFAVFLAGFRFLTAATVPTRCLWIGVAVAAAFWSGLQFVGGLYINHVYRHASAVYSQFALVLALIAWLHLGATLTLYAAEVNVVLARRLYPRSLLGPPEAAADQQTLRALAKVEERHEREQVDVRFDPPRTADQAPRDESSQPATSTAHPRPDNRRTPPDGEPR